MSVPLFTSLLDKSNLKLAINSIISGIEFTQMAAMSYQQPAIFCGSQNHLSCDNHWDEGQLTILSDHQILKLYPALPTSYHLSWKSSLNKNSGVQFNPDGETAGQQGSFYLCKTKTENRLKDCTARIILLKTGRLRIKQTA
jgi:type IV fimbrial biogenesis protein FimT